ncbi:MAG: glycosyltransferase family 2 protein [Leptolyngbya sp. Prado105]|jgi:glycosyltransferase involved in cell wall biosynthesis|nr:glycosyltransferase family 2 protein [Leptolyngbya sp. Prado105]
MKENRSPSIIEPPSKLYPTLTVGIPTYNEAANIERIVQSFLDTQYSNLVEVVIADGGSTDGTQAIIQQLAVRDARVKLLHNPLKVQSAGLNLIVQHSTSEIFLRADAHADYAPDYIERCVEALIKSNALNAGGAQRFAARTPFQVGVALASRSLLGNGGAKYRDPQYNGYADTVYLGCFWREALLKTSSSNESITPFDLTQITNQDAELNLKLLERDRQTIYVSSEVCVWYYPRETWKSLFIQYFKYGRGRYLTTTKHRKTASLRGRLPFLAILTVLILTVLSLAVPILRPVVAVLISLGLLLPFLESLRMVLKFRKNFRTEFWRSDRTPPSLFEVWFICGITLLTMPIAHFSGYSYQLLRQKVFRAQNW